MNELLLKKHLLETPRMEPTDAVKLAYQSAFGCGHLLSARQACADFVRREMETVPACEDAPAAVLIGGGLCRLNLAAPAVRALSPERIADMMMLTNDRVLARADNAARFEESLTQLENLARAGETPFSAEDLHAYLEGYRAQGCPPVSHSEGFRQAYHPAYRVVLSDFAVLLPLIQRMDENACRVVAIDGLCGSGKTTLAALLGSLYGTQPIPMDDFFLPYDLRTAERLSQPGGNVHHERFLSEVLSRIGTGDIAYNRFDCATGALLPRVHRDAGLIIIEGSYSHHPAFETEYRRLNALRVFVSTGDQEQLRRIALRNPKLLESFQSRWIPLEKTYFEAYDISRRADVVLLSQSWDADSLYLSGGNAP